MEFDYTRSKELELESMYNKFVDWKLFYPYEDFRDIFNQDTGYLLIKHKDGSEYFSYSESLAFMKGVSLCFWWLSK